jgi:hypothetical protein
MTADRTKAPPLTLVPPPPDDERMWRRLLNHVYLCEEDELFRWLRSVRQAVRTNREDGEAA